LLNCTLKKEEEEEEGTGLKHIIWALVSTILLSNQASLFSDNALNYCQPSQPLYGKNCGERLRWRSFGLGYVSTFKVVNFRKLIANFQWILNLVYFVQSIFQQETHPFFLVASPSFLGFSDMNNHLNSYFFNLLWQKLEYIFSHKLGTWAVDNIWGALWVGQFVPFDPSNADLNYFWLS